MKKPLLGKVVAVTRPREQSDSLAKHFKKAGARVIVAPLICISPPSSNHSLDQALRNFCCYDIVIFTSANAANLFFKRAQFLNVKSLRPPAQPYAIGPETSLALKRRGWNRVQTPSNYRAEGLIKILKMVRGKKVLIPQAQSARDILPKWLKLKGAHVQIVPVYKTVLDPRGLAKLKQAAKKRLDIICFTSGSAVKQMAHGFNAAERRRLFQKTAAASIGPITTEALKSFGIKPKIVAPKATSLDLFKAVQSYFRENNNHG